jgi:hypothetical protein
MAVLFIFGLTKKKRWSSSFFYEMFKLKNDSSKEISGHPFALSIHLVSLTHPRHGSHSGNTFIKASL